MRNKICAKCLIVKSLVEFRKNKNLKCGRGSYCKPCCVKIDKEYGDRNREKIRAYNRRSDVVARHYIQNKEKRKLNPKKHREYIAAYYIRNKEKVRVRNKFRHLVYTGKIKRKPCEVCGDISVQGHHPDYNKPLEVIWLCIKHHAEKHRKS